MDDKTSKDAAEKRDVASGDAKNPSIAIAPGVRRSKLTAMTRARQTLSRIWFYRIVAHGAALHGEIAFCSQLNMRTCGALDFLKGCSDSADWHARFEQKLVELGPQIRPRDALSRNLNRFAALLDLSPIELQILELAVVAKLDQPLKHVLAEWQSAEPSEVIAAIAAGLDRPENAVAEALAKHSTLRNSRLVMFGQTGPRFIGDTLTTPRGFVDLLREPLATEADLLSAFLGESPAPLLEIGDFTHLAAEVGFAVRYLGSALDRRVKGANLLLYGAPGTGKTELARVLAAGIDARLLEVEMMERDGEPIHSFMRLERYTVGQRALGNRSRAIVLFDEADSCLGLSEIDRGRDRGLLPIKSWQQRLLETNSVPAIWIVNHVARIDPAILRRFDLTIAVGTPPKDTRRAMIAHHLGDLPASPKWIEATASDARITPADIEKAARVSRLVSEPGAESTDADLDRVLGAACVSRRDAARRLANAESAPYDLAYVNASCDLNRLVSSLAKHPRGRLCLYGPPGTGKTAFVYHLGAKLGREVRGYCASDLMCKWVGETERAIAEMFRGADPDRTVLLLDEADTFLKARSANDQSWELSRVNELLVQIEAFDGLFVCCTNMLEVIDEAAFRRFPLKVRFDYLERESCARLFESTLAAANPEPPPPTDLAALRRRLDALAALTPGDFAAVAARARMLGEPLDASTLLKGLAEEHAFKRDAATKRIGF